MSLLSYGVPGREVGEPERAFALAQRLKIHHTPKHGSWLNIAEIERFAGGRRGVLPFVLGLRVRGCVQAVADEHGDARPIWFYSLIDRSWAAVMLGDDQAGSRVWQSGPRRLWEEVEAAYDWWTRHGSPGFERLGLTVAPDGQRAWLDDPQQSWPL
ncbi:hypothetical protein ACO0M4_31215 [Streptomyces sp. RGM 3693]|uniref:hypothetical protein n=1 Tax=Streptomyces sp. RGM 3693 TaxID=3413284 RepID=UPI003D27EA44